MQKEIEKSVHFPKGQLYLIICKTNLMALTLDDPNDPYNSNLVCDQPNPENIKQLFFVQRITSQQFEIVNAASGLVFDEECSHIKLRRGRQNSDQLFFIQPVLIPGAYQYYWIKTTENGDKALKFQNILKYTYFDPKDLSEMFRFIPIKSNNILSTTIVIINQNSGKVMDVPEASIQNGVEIIQFQRNNRFHQRWLFVKGTRGFQIKNFKTKLFLDVSGEFAEGDLKVIQYQNNGTINQFWILEKVSGNTWSIRSAFAPSLFLGVENNGVDDGNKLSLVSYKFQWRFDGPHPMK